MYGTSLTHHGVKGQRWGVRRYQNEDGSPISGSQNNSNNGFSNEQAIAEEKAKQNRKIAFAVTGGVLAGAAAIGVAWFLKHKKVMSETRMADLAAAAKRSEIAKKGAATRAARKASGYYNVFKDADIMVGKGGQAIAAFKNVNIAKLMGGINIPMRHGLTTTNNDRVLVHHGVKGQRWGVRRYQNEDGTLTTEGKKQYDKELRRQDKREEKAHMDKKNANRKSLTKRIVRDVTAVASAASVGYGVVRKLTGMFGKTPLSREENRSANKYITGGILAGMAAINMSKSADKWNFRASKTQEIEDRVLNDGKK